MSAPDVFLSYNSADRPAIVALQKLLHARGITTFLDRENLIAGLPWPQALEQGLSNVKAVAVFIGPHLGGWQKREMSFALDRQVREEKEGRAFPVIPVLLPGADLSAGFLFLNTWIDLRSGIDGVTAVEALDSFRNSIATAGVNHESAEGTTPKAEASAADLCPYRALQIFREEDAAFFVGRREFSRRLLEFTLGKDLVGVVGPSGSGKSSLVQAGLLPLLRRERPPASTWDAVIFTPGRDPFNRLASIVVPLLERDLSETDRLAESYKLGAKLAAGEIRLDAVIERAIDKSNGTDRLLLVADQFEELFTLTPEPGRRPFAQALLSALGKAPFTVVIVLRADFYSQLITLDRELSDRLSPAQVNVGGLTREELRESITVPAGLVGLRFEPGLVERILDDVGNEPGHLPLVEFALTELWQLRKGGLLLNHAYNEIGGVTGALAKRAEAQFGRLAADEQTAARRLFSRLVRVAKPDEAGEDTRERADLTDADVSAKRIASEFADARLLVTGSGSRQGTLSVEVAHEALIRNWERLRGWLNEDREFLLWRQRLQSQVREWEDHDEGADYLLRGTPLSEAERWLMRRQQDLTDAEQRLIRESIALRERERELSEQRRQAEIENSRRLREAAEARAKAAYSLARARRTQLVLTVLIVAAFISVVLISGDAYRKRAELEKETIEAAVPQLVNQSDFLLKYEPGKIDLAALLAAQAIRMHPNANAAQSLGSALALLPQRLVFQADGFNQKSVAFSPDDQYVAFALSDGDTQLRSLNTGEIVKSLHEGSPTHPEHHTLAITTTAGKPDAAFLTVDKKEDSEHAAEPPVDNLQPTTMAGFARIQVLEDSYFPVAFHPTSGFVATTQGDSVARIWSLQDFRITFRLDHSDPVRSVIFSPHGKFLLTIAASKPSGLTRIKLWDTNSWQPRAEIGASGPVSAIRFGPDDRSLAIGMYDGSLRLINLSNFRTTLTQKTMGSIFALAFSPAGDVIATGDMQRMVTVFRVSDGKVLLTVKHPGYVTAVSFSPSGSVLATAGYDGFVRLFEYRGGWADVRADQVKPLGQMKHESEVTSLEFSNDGRYLITASLDHSCRVWEVSGLRELARIPNDTHSNYAVFSPKGGYVASTDLARHSRVWDVGHHGELPWSSESDEVRVYVATESSVYVIVRIGTDGKPIAKVFQDATLKASIPLPGKIEVARVSARGTTLVALSGEKAYVWDLNSGLMLDEGPAKFSMAVSSSGKYVATDWDGESACIQEVGTHKPSNCFQFKNHPRMSLDFSEDERHLLSIEYDKATVREVVTGKEIRTLAPERSNQFSSGSFSRDGKLLAIASGNAITIWDLQGGKKILSLIHDDDIQSVAFSPRGRYLASESGDPYKGISITRIWDLENGLEVNRRNPGFGDTQISFSPDGRRVIAQGGTAQDVWQWNPDDLVEETCARVRRNLTPEEWERNLGKISYIKACPQLP